MKPIPLIKRILYYLLLSLIFSTASLLVALYYGIHCDIAPVVITIPILIFIVFIPHYIFGIIFLRTKWILKLTVPLITIIAFLGSQWLIIRIFGIETDAKAGRTGNYIGDIFGIFLPLISLWEIAYQILKFCYNHTANQH